MAAQGAAICPSALSSGPKGNRRPIPPAPKACRSKRERSGLTPGMAGRRLPFGPEFRAEGQIAAPWTQTAAPGSTGAFTLVELIIVMTLLAIVAALAVPSLSRSMRQRNLDEEATRLLALTEYCRDEAVSQGVPMIVWIDAKSQRYGIEPKAGFDADETRSREYAINPDVNVEIDKAAVSGGVVEAMEFGADGALATSSVDAVRLVDRFKSAIAVSRTTDGWSYELVKEAK